MDEATDTDNTDLIIHLARKTLERSNERSMEVVDFDDMIYAPLFHNVKMFQHDWVLIDEAQDTNESRRLLALRMGYSGPLCIV
jgi:superfamily I DNA/RNA helicase